MSSLVICRGLVCVGPGSRPGVEIARHEARPQNQMRGENGVVGWFCDAHCAVLCFATDYPLGFRWPRVLARAVIDASRDFDSLMTMMATDDRRRAGHWCSGDPGNSRAAFHVPLCNRPIGVIATVLPAGVNRRWACLIRVLMLRRT